MCGSLVTERHGWCVYELCLYQCVYTHVLCEGIIRGLPVYFLGLTSILRENYFGQPFVEQSLLPLLTSHLMTSNPPKALAMSFHGGPGVGKTYLTGLIAKKLFRAGSDSKFYKLITMSDGIEIIEVRGDLKLSVQYRPTNVELPS